jgi:DNA-directed RNA polymerase specialized sigma24 family protein
MMGDAPAIKRENLLEEISAAIRQWPEFEQRVFSQAHYHGQSLEAISRSFQLDIDQVSAILKKCDQRLYAFLKSFPKTAKETNAVNGARRNPM